MSYTYTTWVTSLANMLPVPTTDPGFVTVLPNIIDDAEQFLYRELQLLATFLQSSSGTCVPGSRAIALPSNNGTFVVVDRVFVVTPVGASVGTNGTINPLTPCTRDVLDNLYPSASYSTVPAYFCRLSDTLINVGPWPDQAYAATVSGTVRPTPLSNANQTTVLTTYFPDLWMDASMYFACAYQKNFGAASSDPQSAVSWKAKLDSSLVSAKTEENMKKFRSEGWSSQQPSPLATPPRV